MLATVRAAAAAWLVAKVMIRSRDRVLGTHRTGAGSRRGRLPQPLRLAELHVRIGARLRRGGPTGRTPLRASIEDFTVDGVARQVAVSGRELTLRAKEFDLLARLVAKPDLAVSREALMADVWDVNWVASTKSIDVHVAALRRWLAEHSDADAVRQIVTVRGYGYRLDTPST
jgi:DNA-binding response OmpR family regulator